MENKSTSNTTSTSDKRHSDTPQNQIDGVKNGDYVTDYNFDTNINSGNDSSTSAGNSVSKSNSTDKNNYEETITRTVSDKINIMKEMQTNIDSIYSLIFSKLDVLFYGLL